MSKVFRKAILLVVAVMTAINPMLHAFAATACTNGSQYFYINGVSPWADLHRGEAARTIQSLLLARGIITTEVVTPLRNPSDGLFIDVFVELANQKLAEKSAVTFAESVQKSTMMFTGNPAYAMSASDQTLLDAKIADFFNRSKNLPNTTAVTAGMIDSVSAALNAGDKAIVIAHSQGNMFANAILNSVIANQSPNIAAGLKIVSVATPASTAQDSRYKTANQDRVINIMATTEAAAMGAPLPLGSNIDVPGALNYDTNGHGLLEVYLNPSLTAVDLVLTMVGNAATAAANPRCPQIAAICPDTFTQTQLGQVRAGMTVSQVDGIFGCAGRNSGFSNWYMWYNDVSLMSMTLNTASVFFTNGVYLAGSPKSISGTVIP
jgi:microcompartment protein CcmL/EutN